MKLDEFQLDRASYQNIRAGQCYDSRGRGHFLHISLQGESPDFAIPDHGVGLLEQKKYRKFATLYGTHVVKEIKLDKNETDPFPRLVDAVMKPIHEVCPERFSSQLRSFIEDVYIKEEEPVFILARTKPDHKCFSWALQVKKEENNRENEDNEEEDQEEKEIVLVNQIDPEHIKSLVDIHLSSPNSEENQEGTERKKRKVSLGSSSFLPSLFNIKSLNHSDRKAKIPSAFSLETEGKRLEGKRRAVVNPANEKSSASPNSTFFRHLKSQLNNEYRVQQSNSNKFWSIAKNTSQETRSLRLSRNVQKASEFKFFLRHGIMVPQNAIQSRNDVKENENEEVHTENSESYTSSDDEHKDEDFFSIEESIGQGYMKVIEDSLLHFLNSRAGYLMDAAAVVSEIREFSEFPVSLVDYCLQKLSTKSSLTKESHNGVTLYGMTGDDEFERNLSSAPSDYGNNKYRLYIKPISKDLDRETLLAALRQKLDGVTNIILHQDPLNMNRNRGFTFVDFDTEEHARKAHEKIHTQGLIIRDIAATSDWATPLNDPSDQVMAQVKGVFVRYLPLDITESYIIDTFTRFGQIEKIKRSRDFCFVHFTERSSALEAIKTMNGQKVQNNVIEVTLAKPLDPVIRQQQLAHKRRMYGHEPYYPTTLTFPNYNDKGEIIGYGPPQPRMKLEMCDFFKRGACARGDQCRFAHGEQELGTPAPAQSTSTTSTTPSSRPPILRGGLSSPYRPRGRGIHQSLTNTRGGYSDRGRGSYSIRNPQNKRSYDDSRYGYDSYSQYSQYDSQYAGGYMESHGGSHAASAAHHHPSSSSSSSSSSSYYQYPPMYQYSSGGTASNQSSASYQAMAAYYQGQYYQMPDQPSRQSGGHYPGY